MHDCNFSTIVFNFFHITFIVAAQVLQVLARLWKPMPCAQPLRHVRGHIKWEESTDHWAIDSDANAPFRIEFKYPIWNWRIWHSKMVGMELKLHRHPHNDDCVTPFLLLLPWPHSKTPLLPPPRLSSCHNYLHLAHLTVVPTCGRILNILELLGDG